MRGVLVLGLFLGALFGHHKLSPHSGETPCGPYFEACFSAPKRGHNWKAATGFMLLARGGLSERTQSFQPCLSRWVSCCMHVNHFLYCCAVFVMCMNIDDNFSTLVTVPININVETRQGRGAVRTPLSGCRESVPDKNHPDIATTYLLYRFGQDTISFPSQLPKIKYQSQPASLTQTPRPHVANQPRTHPYTPFVR